MGTAALVLYLHILDGKIANSLNSFFPFSCYLLYPAVLSYDGINNLKSELGTWMFRCFPSQILLAENIINGDGRRCCVQCLCSDIKDFLYDSEQGVTLSHADS